MDRDTALIWVDFELQESHVTELAKAGVEAVMFKDKSKIEIEILESDNREPLLRMSFFDSEGALGAKLIDHL